MNDNVFTKPIKKQFEFDEEVAAVFDDMLERSVPFYKESQKITEFFALKNLSELAGVYDLGCSTASTLLNIHRNLSKKAEGEANPLQASVYTGIAYIFTVFFLVAPYFLFASSYTALPVMLSIGIGIILIFTFFVSVTKDQPFGSRFLEMAAISLGVAFVSFVIGYFLNRWIGV